MTVDPRTEAIKQIKDRYKTLKGAGFDAEALPKQTEQKVEEKKAAVATPAKPERKSAIEPYLMLIENDLRSVLRLRPKELKKKPVDLKWLEQKRRFF